MIEKTDTNADLRQLPAATRSGILFVAIFLALMAVLAWSALGRIENNVRQEAAYDLQTVLNASDKAIDLWAHDRMGDISYWASSPAVIEFTKKLLELPPKKNTLLQSPALKDIRAYFKPLLEQNKDLGFFILSPEFINIASERDSNIGDENVVARAGLKRAYLAEVFGGKTHLFPPIRLDVALPGLSGELGENYPTMFIMAPIRDENGGIIAALAVSIDVSLEFTDILTIGRLGESGETYMFDKDAKLISESRFEGQLRSIGLLKPGERSILSIDIRDPGGNMLEGFIPDLPRHEQPLTYMARQAVSGKSGIETQPYNNYRGVPVLGAWHWIEDLNIGITTEIDQEEALKPFYAVRRIILIVLTLTATLSLSLSWAIVFFRKRAERELKKRRDYIELLQDVLWQANESDSINETLRFCIDRVCSLTSWPVGHVYTISDDNPEILEPTDIWSLKDEARHKVFHDVTMATNFSKGAGLIGRVLADRKPVWIVDVSKDPNYLRHRAAKDIGVKAAFAFPILVGDSVIAVLEFVSPEAIEPDKQLLEIMEQIGTQAGKVIERKKAEEELEKHRNHLEELVENRTSELEKANAELEREIAERIQVGKELLKLSSAIEQSDEMVVVTDAEGIIEYVNPAGEKITGYSQEEALGKTPGLLRSGHHDAKFYKDMWSTIKSGDIWHGNIINRKKSGELYHEEMTISPVKNDMGEIMHFVAIKRDITERIRNEEQLRDSEERLELALVGGDLGFWDANLVTRKTVVNGKWANMLGYKLDEIEDNHLLWLDSVHPEDKERVLKKGEDYREGRIPVYEAEYRAITRSGEVIWLLSKGAIVKRDDKGAPVRMSGTVLNITERKLVEENLRKSEKNLAKAQEIALLGSMEWDLATDNVTWSYHIYRMLNLKLDKVAPSLDNFLEFVHPDDREAFRKAVVAAAKESRLVDMEFRVSPKNRSERIFHARGEVERDAFGKPVRVVGSLQDITEQKQIQEELRKSKETAEEATKLKDKFVSMVAHDLRSPFTTILGYMELVARDSNNPLQPKHKELIDRAISGGKKLVDMIEQLLTISRFRTGKIQLHGKFMDARLMVHSHTEVMQTLAEKKGINLVNELPRGTRIYADYNLFGEVVLNLVSNAVKFCKNGDQISIISETGNGVTTIAVKDTGVGIPKEFIPNLFKHEIKTSLTGTAGETGTGLGLPFCCDIVKAHGGSLTVESVEGEGSVFCAKLPVVRPLIMVVADDRTIRKLFIQQMKSIDADFIEVENGGKAIELSQKQTPHLIVLDVVMPAVDSFGLLEHIRNNPETKSIPVIVMTSEVKMEIRDRAFKMGANDFVQKPFITSDMLPRVKRFVG